MCDDTQLSEKTRCLLSFTCQICRHSIIPFLTRFHLAAPRCLHFHLHHSPSPSLSLTDSFLTSPLSASHFSRHHLCLNHGHLHALLSLSLTASLTPHNPPSPRMRSDEKHDWRLIYFPPFVLGLFISYMMERRERKGDTEDR